MNNIERTIKALDDQEIMLHITMPWINGHRYERKFYGKVQVKEDMFSVEEKIWANGKVILLLPYLCVDSVSVGSGGPPHATIRISIVDDDEFER